MSVAAGSRVEYRVCTRCVMDTSDPEITFDEVGVCSHCRHFDAVTSRHWFPNEEGRRRLSGIIDDIRATGRGRRYDCIIGLSGGVDSSYTALKVFEWGLRPLVVHVDAGWNSELAVANIERIVKHCGYHLHTHVVDWDEMRDLQLAYLRAGVANQDVPQDHAIFASTYHFATKHRLRYVISGGNIASESVFPGAWLIDAMDSINLLAIHRRYGQRRLRTFSRIGYFDYYVWYPFVKRLRTIRPLNYMPYTKAGATEELSRTLGWRPYGRKHGESLFTKLYQNYYLPERFGYDKRRPHLASLIMSGQLTRERALRELELPLYEADELETDINYFCKKIRISRDEFETFVRAPARHYSEFRNGDAIHRQVKRAQLIAERLLGRHLKVYS